MWKRLASKITHNFPLKLVSVLIAIVFWYIAIYNSDPKETRSYSVRVEVTNDSYIASGKQVYYIDEANKSVTVYVTDNVSKLNNINENYISVIADLTQIVDFNRDPVMVPLSATCAGVSPANLSLSKEAIPITIENVASKELPITVSTKETVPNKNYEIGSLTPDISSITVDGPESIISNIDSVVAVINVTNMSVSAERKASLSFIDKEQNEIPEEQILEDITIEGDFDSVNVYVELWRKRSGVTFNVNYSGQPAEGYRVSQTSTSPDEITVAGNADALSILESVNNIITIPASRIDISGRSEDLVTDIEIADLLPGNMKIASSMNSYITVTISIMPIDSKEFSLDVDNIAINNLNPDYAVSYTKTDIPVKIRSATQGLIELQPTDIIASIDLAAAAPGDWEIPVAITLPEGYELVDPITITVTIKDRTKESTTETNAGTNTTNPTTTPVPTPESALP